MAAYSFSWKIALLVAVVMLVVVVSYRQNVHACPPAGLRGASVKLGPKTGVTVASALLVHYVLTVAVSIFFSRAAFVILAAAGDLRVLVLR